jgi:hypothetical protein
MYNPTWNEQVRTLPQAEAIIDRLVSEQVDRKPIALNKLNSDDIVAVISQWLKEFYEENQQNPPHHLYPFDENQLREFGKSRPTVRSVLKWCADKFVVPNSPINEEHPVEPYFQQELKNIQTSIDSLLDDEFEIANALRLAFCSLIRETLEGVKIDNIKEIQANKVDKGYINFKIVGNDGKVKIGVAVLQQSGGKYVGAALKRLIDYEKFDLTRGCLVRSKKINVGAAVPRECLRILLHEKGGEWVMLQSNDITPLLAISLVNNCESYELTEEQIINFIQQKKLAINNPLIREILSDPSGQEPSNLTDNDLPIRVPTNSSITFENIDLQPIN